MPSPARWPRSSPDAATTDTAEQWLNQNSAGTGPFIMTRYVPDSEVDVQKFAGYWKKGDTRDTELPLGTQPPPNGG